MARTIPFVAGPGWQQGGVRSVGDVEGDGDLPPATDRKRTLALLALGVAIVYFAWRGVVRGWFDSGDLTVAFTGGRAWLAGLDPYAVGVLQQQLAGAGGNADLVSQLERLRNVFAPTTLPALAVLGVLPWGTAQLLWLLLNVGATLVVALGLGMLLGWQVRTTRTIALTALILALAPVHSTIASGQTGLVATASLVMALLAQRRGHPVWTALLYALAVALKVQIGLPFLAYLAWRRWRTAVLAAAILVGATAVAIARLQAAALPWTSSWMANLALMSSPGGINDPGPLNDDRYSLINLQYPLHSLLPAAAADVVTYLAIGVAAGVMVWLHRDREPRFDLLALSTVAVLALLVTYHRYYDAVVLAFPIAWAIANLRATSRRQAIVVLVLAADFVLPAQTALHDIQVRGLVPGWLVANPAWDGVLLAQHSWVLVLIALTLLWAGWRERAAVPGPVEAVVAPSVG